MAIEKPDRSQPNSFAIGSWKTPKLARMAKFSTKIAQPAINTGEKRLDLVMARMLSGK